MEINNNNNNSHNNNNNQQRINKSYSLSNEELNQYETTTTTTTTTSKQYSTSPTQQQHQQIFYSSPQSQSPYSRVIIPIENTINEEDYRGRPISPGNIAVVQHYHHHHIQQQQQQQTSPLSIKKSNHKRSNSHGLPPKSILHHSPPNNSNSYLSPTTLINNSSNSIGFSNFVNNNGYSVRSTPPQQSPNILSPPILPSISQQQQQPINIISSSTPPTIPIKKRVTRQIATSMDNNNGNLVGSFASISQQYYQQQSQQQHKDSPPTSPRISGNNINHSIGVNLNTIDINHRRAVSWEPLVQGKSLEALNQLIKEKKEALLLKEKELMQKQMQLEQEFISRREPISPPIPIIQTSSPQPSPPQQQSFSPFIIGSPSNIINNSNSQQTTPRPILKHNRSKSDTNSAFKQVQQHLQQSKKLATSPTSTTISTGYITTTTTTSNISNTPPQQQQTTNQSPSFPSKTRYHHEKSKSMTSPKINSALLTQLLQHQLQQQQQINQQQVTQQQQQYNQQHIHPITPSPQTLQQPSLSSKAPRRKSIDPLTFISLNSHLQQQQQTGSPILNNSNQNNINLLNQNFNNLHLSSSSKAFKNPLTVQFLNTIQSMNLDEFEEELDKEIQQVILQTKNIQGKMDLLERARCAAPDPLLMLFGENCKNIIDKKYHHHSHHQSPIITNISGNNHNNSPILLSSPTSSQQQQSMLSPNLQNINNIYPTFQDTRPHNGIMTSRTSRTKKPSLNMNSRCPDKSKSKNLNPSLMPRASAFSPINS